MRISSLPVVFRVTFLMKHDTPDLDGEQAGCWTEQQPFKWRHFQADIILLCVR
jgi:hypothetical protein